MRADFTGRIAVSCYDQSASGRVKNRRRYAQDLMVLCRTLTFCPMRWRLEEPCQAGNRAALISSCLCLWGSGIEEGAGQPLLFVRLHCIRVRPLFSYIFLYYCALNWFYEKDGSIAIVAFSLCSSDSTSRTSEALFSSGNRYSRACSFAVVSISCIISFIFCL